MISWQVIWIVICIAIGAIFYMSVDEPTEGRKIAAGLIMGALVWAAGNVIVRTLFNVIG